MNTPSEPVKIETAPEKQHPAPRSREDQIKRWIAVLIAFVTLLIGFGVFLQTQASGRAAQFYRRAQENALAGAGIQTRGQQQVTYAKYTVKREYDELTANAGRLKDNDPVEASVYVTASKEITKLSPLLSPPYMVFNNNDTRTTYETRYEADTWIITSTLLSERREDMSSQASAWDGKGNNYTAALAIFAVTLFLFGLALTLGGCLRSMFVLLGMALVGAATLWMGATALWPIHATPDAAMQRVATGYGLFWQAEYEDARVAFDDAIKLDDQYANAYYWRGSVAFYVKPQRYDQAIQYLLKASRLDNSKYSVFWNLGWAYFLNGDYALSSAASQHALELNPRVCGPVFNIAIARLASGDSKQAEKDYEAGITHCANILAQALADGLDAPSSLWRDLSSVTEDIENLLCATHGKYCYQGREQPDVKKVLNKSAILDVGEKYRKRLKEVATALEFKHSTQVRPSGARFEPLQFTERFLDDDNSFVSYVVRDLFPFHGPTIYARWIYSDTPGTLNEVWKIYRNGTEDPALRYANTWVLDTNGSAYKKISSWYWLEAGHYTVEVYGNNELLTSGEFDIDSNEKLRVDTPTNVKTGAQVNVGPLIMADDFANNNHGWFTGAVEADGKPRQEGKFANNEYSIVTHVKDAGWWVTCDDCGNLTDGYYEVNTRFNGGSATSAYGLVLRGNRGLSNAYLFYITGEGYYSIRKRTDSKSSPLVDYTTTSAIKPKGTNRLGVLVRGNTFEFFINGQSVNKVTDSTYTKGYLGLVTGGTDMEIAYSELRVWQLR